MTGRLDIEVPSAAALFKTNQSKDHLFSTAKIKVDKQYSV